MVVNKEQFEESVLHLIESKSSKRKFYSATEYEALINKIRQREAGLPFDDKNDYRKVSAFRVEEIDGTHRVVHTETGKIVVPTEDFFRIISKAHHEETIHGGISVTLKNLRSKYFNIHQSVVSKFINLCDVCEMKRNKHHSSEVVKPILTEEMNGRCQIDLIDYQSRPDGEYKFVLVYQDHFTKYVILRALKAKTMESIVEALFPIFIDFGAPLLVHTDNGREFANMLLEALVNIWPDCTLLHGKPRHSQSQGSVERANQDVEKKLASWMTDNKSTNWSRGLPFVQYAKNRCFHRGIGCTPFEAMFGIKCRNDLEKLALPSATLRSLKNEEDLERLQGEQGNNESDSEASSSTSSASRAAGNDGNTPSTSSASRAAENDGDTPSTSSAFSPAPDCSSASVAQGDVLARKLANFEKIRENCRKRQARQADEMLTRSAKKRATGIEVGTSVRVPVPLVDRAKSDQRNILAVVTEARIGNLYILGTKCGKLEGSYSTNQFEVCKGKFLQLSDVPTDKIITLREASGLLSVGGASQGFVKCSCKKTCGSKCKCVSNGMVCNSRCHKNLSCNNYYNK